MATISTQIAGYAFEGEMVTARGIKAIFGEENSGCTAEELLDSMARERGIDRDDERSFDFYEFPKVVLTVEADETWLDGFDERGMPVYLKEEDR